MLKKKGRKYDSSQNFFSSSVLLKKKETKNMSSILFILYKLCICITGEREKQTNEIDDTEN
jgi:hypothetical protein